MSSRTSLGPRLDLVVMFMLGFPCLCGLKHDIIHTYCVPATEIHTHCVLYSNKY